MAEKLKQAGDLSRKTFGDAITFFLPGMFSCDGVRGNYPAISLTGTRCALNCDHCQGILLRSMIPATTPARLAETCARLWDRGVFGVLISGGCDREGRLPWRDFIPAIRGIKRKTGLFISVHSGLVDDDTAHRLRDAGVDQALIDIIGLDETYQRIYHVDFGIERIVSSMESLNRAALPVVPHIVCGLHYGEIRGEKEAIRILSGFDAAQVVIVSLMRLSRDQRPRFALPAAEAVADIIAEARLKLPDVRISLGCARERGNTLMERLAIDAGVSRMAIPSEEAVAYAREKGMKTRFQRTCCSVSMDCSGDRW